MSSSLGDRQTQAPLRVKNVIAQEDPQMIVSTVGDAVSTFSMTTRVLRALMFVACVTVGVWAYANPEDAVEAITTIDLDSQKAQFTDLAVLLASVTNSSSTATIPDVNAFLMVFVRVFATLVVATACGIPSRYDSGSRLLSLTGYLLAFGLFMDVSIRDNGQVLELWFVTVYAIFACGIPALVCGFEARYSGLRS
jgi:hypothetical protein